MRRLIVNADDLGLSEGVNGGILEAHEHGILTSTSLMVDEEAAEQAVEVSAGAGLSVGLHAVLDRGRAIPVSPQECPRELERQLARFERLTGRHPTHLDSHHHLHREPALREAFIAFAELQGLPLRDRAARHCGSFYGRWGGVSHPEQIGVAGLLEILEGIEEGVTELCCHPGYADGLVSSYTVERERELAALTDPRVRARVGELGIRLTGWEELP